VVRKSSRDKSGSHDLGIQPNPEEGPLADRHVAVLGPLAPADEEGAAVEVHVSQPQGDEFAAPQPRRSSRPSNTARSRGPRDRGSSGVASRLAISAALKVASGMVLGIINRGKEQIGAINRVLELFPFIRPNLQNSASRGALAVPLILVSTETP
jgi:hypothetical protein